MADSSSVEVLPINLRIAASYLNVSDPIKYNTNTFGNTCLQEDDLLKPEDSSVLFDGSPIFVREAVRRLSACYIDFNLSKCNIIRLLRTIKELLPRPNRLLIARRSLMKVFGYVSSSRKTFLCALCFQRS